MNEGAVRHISDALEGSYLYVIIVGIPLKLNNIEYTKNRSIEICETRFEWNSKEQNLLFDRNRAMGIIEEEKSIDWRGNEG